MLDVRGRSGERLTGIRFRMTSIWDGSNLGEVVTEEKSSDAYAANFPMWAVAPAYRVEMLTGDPAEGVTGLGMGTPTCWYCTEHVSYGFVWEWVEAGH